jgi:hypothetical protein
MIAVNVSSELLCAFPVAALQSSRLYLLTCDVMCSFTILSPEGKTSLGRTKRNWNGS